MKPFHIFIICISTTLLSAQTKLDSLINKQRAGFISTTGAAGISIGIYNNGKISFFNFGTSGKLTSACQVLNFPEVCVRLLLIYTVYTTSTG